MRQPCERLTASRKQIGFCFASDASLKSQSCVLLQHTTPFAKRLHDMITHSAPLIDEIDYISGRIVDRVAITSWRS